MINLRIKNRWKQLGLTEDELAKKVGYKTKAAISRIENCQYCYIYLKQNTPLNLIKDVIRVSYYSW